LPPVIFSLNGTYVLTAAYSQSGKIDGPWIQDEELFFEDNGGHGMLFYTFEGKLMLSMHYVDPNDETPGRQPAFFEVDDSGDAYLENKPVVDEFGQWNLGEFEGKVHSLEEKNIELLKEKIGHWLKLFNYNVLDYFLIFFDDYMVYFYGFIKNSYGIFQHLF